MAYRQSTRVGACIRCGGATTQICEGCERFVCAACAPEHDRTELGR